MNKINKLKLIEKAIKKSRYFDYQEQDIDKLTKDILKKTSFIFELTESENEIYNYLKTIADASIIKMNEGRKKKNMAFSADKYQDVIDPVTLSFDNTREDEYIKKILSMLYIFEQNKPEKSYASIFYERYIEKLDLKTIAKMHETNENEISSRILDIARAVSKEMDNKLDF